MSDCGDGEGIGNALESGVVRMSSVRSEGVAKSVKVVRVMGQARVKSLRRDRRTVMIENGGEENALHELEETDQMMGMSLRAGRHV